MSGSIEIKGSPELVEHVARWLNDLPLDYYASRRCTACRRALPRGSAQLNAHAQFDHDQEKREGWSIPDDRA